VNPILESAKRLALGIFLIALAAGVLLYSDRGSRNRRAKQALGATANLRVYHVAVVQGASQPIIEEGLHGVMEALKTRGYEDGERLSIRRYNAEADIATANSIAKDVTSGGNDLIITLTTPSLQTVANANKNGARTPHVFGLVTDPYASGVGINVSNHLDHPPYLTGLGSLQPVTNCFRVARKLRPELKTVGLVWNSAEINSLVQTKLARGICAELGIELVEANAENTMSVSEAANSLVARGVEAIWVSGDVTVLVAVDAVISAAKRGRIPVFTVIPPTVNKGALFDVGGNHFEIGKATGELAADVLDGKSPAEIPVENFTPEGVDFNILALADLKSEWKIPDELRQQANLIIDESGSHSRAVANQTTLRAPAGRNFKIGLAYFAPEPGAETCMKGIFDGLRDLGFEEGKNLEVRRAHAQAEIANIPSMLQNFDSSDVDLILPMTTPVISGACGMVKRKPVVFTYCSDPIAAGAGTTFSNHLPHVTGIGSFPPVQDMVDLIHTSLPQAKSIGTIYNASEANSVKVVQVAHGLFAAAGMRLEDATVANSSEVLQAAQALASRKVDAFYIQGDNTVIQAFDAVVRAARDARLPLFTDDPDSAKRGGVACVGLGYYRPGYAAATPIARVLLGEKPANIAMKNVSEKALWLDVAAAQKLGIQFPQKVIDEAGREATKSPPKASVIANNSGSSRAGKPLAHKAQLELIEYIDTPNVEVAREGVFAGLAQANLQLGRDFDLRVRNAQGDMATLSSMVDAAAQTTDLLILSTTPALQSALQRASRKPLVFTLVANPVVAGAGKSDTDHLPFVTGSYITAPHEEGLAALKQCVPGVKRIGTLFVPAEVNSVYYKDQLLAAASKAGLEVETVGVSSSGEIADGAMALCGRSIDVFCQISDNLTGASFASLAQVAKRARIPLIGFASAQVRNGAFMTISRDFHDGGVASGVIAARILRGEKPADIPFELVTKIRYAFNIGAAAQSGIVIPDSLLKKGAEVIR
jgi:ABC-type uncharacterized transport system substrate-binding protein